MLATYSLLPIVQAWTRTAGVAVETRDISLAGRVLAAFPDSLTTRAALQRRSGRTGRAGEDAGRQHHQAAQHQRLGAAAAGGHQGTAGPGLMRCPDYPESPAGDAQKKMKARYAKVSGSAVNPVLREGNSDRRVAKAVKQYARTHPHSMGAWSKDSKTPRGQHGRR